MEKIIEETAKPEEKSLRFFYVRVERAGALKWTCNLGYTYVLGLKLGESICPTKFHNQICGCDDSNEEASWAGCTGYLERVVEVQEYDERFRLMLEALSKNLNIRKILGDKFYDRIMLNFERNSEVNGREHTG